MPNNSLPKKYLPKSSRAKVKTITIGVVQTNTRGDTTDIIIRPDNWRLMNGFPGNMSDKNKTLLEGILYTRATRLKGKNRKAKGKKPKLTIRHEATIINLAKIGFKLHPNEVDQNLRRIKTIRPLLIK